MQRGTAKSNATKTAAGSTRSGGVSSDDVDAFMALLVHPHKTAIEALRQAVLAADPRIGEGVKWNAPSFHAGQWFATMHLRGAHAVTLVLHLGAKKTNASETGLAIDDPAGLLQWPGKDRATIRIEDLADLDAKRQALTALLGAWIKHLA